MTRYSTIFMSKFKDEVVRYDGRKDGDGWRRRVLNYLISRCPDIKEAIQFAEQKGRDDVEITIPNSVMGKAKIINESGGPHAKERIRLKCGVAYGSDLDQVREALMEVARDHPREAWRQPEPTSGPA